jgi:hypothetical protein
MSAVDFKLESLAVLVILLPGFLAARIHQRLIFDRDRSELDKIVQALLYSFVIYVVYTIFRQPLPFRFNPVVTEAGTHYEIQSDPLRLVALLGISVVLAVLLAYIAENDFAGRLFRKLGVSERTWRDSIWSDVFHDYGEAVRVELADGRSVMGWLRLYSDSAQESSLFLERAAWVDENDQLQHIKGPGIFLTKESGILAVSFLYWRGPTVSPK